MLGNELDPLNLCPLTVCHLHLQNFLGAFLQEKDENQCTFRKADTMLEGSAGFMYKTAIENNGSVHCSFVTL